MSNDLIRVLFIIKKDLARIEILIIKKKRMKPLNKTLILVAVVLLNLNYVRAQHTFSIVAVDPATGEVGSAGGTCLSSEDGARDVSDIVIGVGAINTQSFWNATNQTNARDRMLAGDSPDEIITWLQNNDVEGSSMVAYRQYGVVDINGANGRSAAFTGSANYDKKGHRTGADYAIQGNILISEDVLDDMETAFNNTSGSLCSRLMAVMQAAKRPGADDRCLSSGLSCKSAYIRVAKPSDTDSSYGNLWLDINVWLDSGTFTGDPIDELQLQYDIFKATLGVDDYDDFYYYPNPTSGVFRVSEKSSNNGVKIMVFDSMGRKVLEEKKENEEFFVLNLNSSAKGIYFVKIYNKQNQLIHFNKIWLYN